MDKIAFSQALILDDDKTLAVFEKAKSFLKHCLVFFNRLVSEP
jgi:hypothetical protein